nr:MYB transcription factor [Callianthemum taipaicum]
MIKRGMEILAPYSNWLLGESKGTKWTQQENKLFENALAIYDKDTPDRWQRVTDMIPGKTVLDVFNQYKELENDVSDIEAGLIPIPGYNTSSFTLEWMNNHPDCDGLKQSYGSGVKRTLSARPSEHERKKGVPWTEEEHKLFLLGLKKYGKGDWRNISRNFVITRTPTQVASHAQKYFIRQHSGGKDKRRSSIHDITTVNCIEGSPSPDNNIPHSPNHSTTFSQSQQPKEGRAAKAHFGWSQPHNRANAIFSPTQGNLIIPPTYGITSNEMKFQGQSLRGGTLSGSHVIPRTTMLPMHCSQRHPNG